MRKIAMAKKKRILIVSILLGVVLLCVSLITFLHIIPEWNKQENMKNAVLNYRKNKIESYKAENDLYDDFEVDVAFLGDSLTDGYDLEKYYPKYKVANRGIGGDTTFDLEDRLQVSAFDLKPKVVVMLIGANNFFTMFDNYERIVSSLKTNLLGTKIVLLSLTAMSGEYWGKNNEIACLNNVKIAKIAEKYDCEFVDLFSPLFDMVSNGIKAEYTTDGGHLTPKGYEVVTSVVTPILEQILN